MSINTKPVKFKPQHFIKTAMLKQSYDIHFYQVNLNNSKPSTPTETEPMFKYNSLGNYKIELKTIVFASLAVR